MTRNEVSPDHPRYDISVKGSNFEIRLNYRSWILYVLYTMLYLWYIMNYFLKITMNILYVLMICSFGSSN